MTKSKIWCLLINHNKKPVGNPFSVQLSSEDDIDDLKQKVEKKMSNLLADTGVDRITVWRCPTLFIREDSGRGKLKLNEIENRINKINFDDENMTYEVAVSANVESIDIAGNETLLVEMPCAFFSS
jgi:hypothetical protein